MAIHLSAQVCKALWQASGKCCKWLTVDSSSLTKAPSVPWSDVWTKMTCVGVTRTCRMTDLNITTFQHGVMQDEYPCYQWSNSCTALEVVCAYRKANSRYVTPCDSATSCIVRTWRYDINHTWLCMRNEQQNRTSTTSHVFAILSRAGRNSAPVHDISMISFEPKPTLR